MNDETEDTTITTFGRLEIYLDDRWGTVCDDGFFDEDAANAACRQMGFTGAERYGTNLG